MTLTTSIMWVSRLMSRLIKCERSPRPVNVGVNTLCPFRSSRSDTRLQHHPPVPGAMHQHECLACVLGFRDRDPSHHGGSEARPCSKHDTACGHAFLLLAGIP